MGGGTKKGNAEHAYETGRGVQAAPMFDRDMKDKIQIKEGKTTRSVTCGWGKGGGGATQRSDV